MPAPRIIQTGVKRLGLNTIAQTSSIEDDLDPRIPNRKHDPTRDPGVVALKKNGSSIQFIHTVTGKSEQEIMAILNADRLRKSKERRSKKAITQ